MTDMQAQEVMLSAIASSARPLLQILRCIGFSSKAHVHLSDVGIRISVHESRVMQGSIRTLGQTLLICAAFAFLQKELFSNFNFRADLGRDESSNQDPTALQISLESLIETLLIFGINESRDRWSTQDSGYGVVTAAIARGATEAAFDNRVLGTAGLCKLTYERPGAPLCIDLEESGITTTCELTTYEPDPVPDIPFDQQSLVQKIIMQASLLHDAVSELSATNPSKVTMIASKRGRYLALSSTGAHGSATVEFSTDPQLFETFDVSQRVVNTYKYSLMQNASRTMATASKVSVRVDQQGVLSLQFLIELDTGLKSFVDFIFVPFIEEENEGLEESDEAEERDGSEYNHAAAEED